MAELPRKLKKSVVPAVILWLIPDVMIRFSGLILLFVLLVGCDSPAPEVSVPAAPEVAPAPAALPQEISFNQHIQPILSEYCYHCHGPDAKTRRPDEAPLRLDREEDAFAVREDGKPVIIKGKPDESNLVKRMLTHDPDLIMPPPESHKQMKAEEIALVKKWIEQGAEYEPHWSFAPVKRPEPPAAGEGWGVNPIDAFIAARLAEQGLQPNPADDLRRYHRRMAFDLTGLPPEPAATDAFLDDYAKRGEAAVVAEADRLMDTTASAEHFARLWLDVARYADTHGIHIDNYRAIWPYRDWVVRAFKQNMPWDKFTTEQIAGDLIPNRSLDQLVASGFNRCMATTGEGGAIAEEYEAVYAKDQVETVSAVWLGLTTGCAACHDHKFDPVSMKDFYSMAAFFRNTTMHAMDKNDALHPPNVFVPELPDRERWLVLEKELADHKRKLDQRASKAETEFQTWLGKPELKPYVETDESVELYLPLAGGGASIEGFVGGKPRSWPVALDHVDGLIGKAPVITGQSIALGDIANWSRDSEVTVALAIRVEGTPSGSLISRMDPSLKHRGWDLGLENGKPILHVVDRWEDAESRGLAGQALTPGVWHFLTVAFDGSKAGHQSISMTLNGKRLDAKVYPNTAGGLLENEVPLRIGSREGGDAQLKGGQVAIQDLRIYRRVLSSQERGNLARTSQLLEAVKAPADKRTPEQVKLLKDYYLNHVDGEYLAAKRDYERLRGEETGIRKRGSVSLVMEEKSGEPFAHILNRGVYSDKGEKVGANTPESLLPMPEGAPKNRLGLAQWLNDPRNPLPARVTMNRAWSYLFGKGIVETNGDFGIMGARPSHPQLLDWLAAEFVDSGWNYRHMVKLMVTSMAYRQSGAVDAVKLQKDPGNALLSRGPRHRLDGEQLRDMALWASGLLNPKVGGPPVKPYQPEGIWQAVAMPQSNTRFYKQDFGDKLYRRSLYTIWKRTAPPPTMEIFNAPTREVFCVQRERTNTPLQALALLNDPQFVEACRELALRVMQESGTVDERLDGISLRLLSRSLSHDERDLLKAGFESFLKDYQAQPEEAMKLVTTGEKPLPEKVDVPMLAAWTLVASQILNLDETLTR